MLAADASGVSEESMAAGKLSYSRADSCRFVGISFSLQEVHELGGRATLSSVSVYDLPL